VNRCGCVHIGCAATDTGTGIGTSTSIDTATVAGGGVTDDVDWHAQRVVSSWRSWYEPSEMCV
jgi:hypothetical protein